jgi:PAS domain S-box-containing protein
MRNPLEGIWELARNLLLRQGLRALAALGLAAGFVLPAKAEAPRQITLHLKWSHQFQFAGYYAAKEKGFYRAEGLEVTLLEAGPSRLPIPAVEKGEAQFGVSDIEVFQAYLEGRPLVALGVIFQHSPNVILSLRGKGILRPADLTGRKVMFQGGQGLAEAQAMLHSEGLRLDSIQQVPHSWNLDDLLTGRVDAIQAYSTNEPYLLKLRGADVVQLQPIAYGVDFYGDLIFTTRSFAAANPEVTAAFLRASFQGWEYAMEHPEEMIDRILAMPGLTAQGMTREKLRFEAEQMKVLVMPGLVDAGHMNPGRFRRIAETLVKLGIAKTAKNPEGFVYAPPVPPAQLWLRTLKVVVPAALAIGLLVAIWITQLRRSVYARTKALLKEVQQRKRAEEILRESEGRFRSLLQCVDAIAIQSYGPDGTTQYWNRASERLYGYTEAEALGRNLLDLIIPDEMREDVALAMRTMGESGVASPSSELSLVRKDRSRVAVFSSHAIVRAPGRPPEMFCLDIDLTDRKRLEAQLRQSQKLESLGSLAGGVAHDMNNVLGAILGMASLHGEQAPPGSALARGLETITRAAERGGKMVKSLLNFARQSPVEVRAVDLNTILGEEAKLLERTTLSKVRLELDLDPTLRAVRGDAGALSHAFLNLCVNAVDAMPDGGTLRLRTRNIDPDWIEVLVEDSGCGMPQEVQEKAMDPFFTTKEHGKGTGLGLSIVYGTVVAHKGQLEIQSAPGEGTCIRMRFPVGAPLPMGEEPVVEQRSGPVSGSLSVLLVDDDELIQSSIQTVLQTLGHQVTVASTGEEALALIDPGKPPDVVFLDMNMPGLGGAGTLQHLRVLLPETPVLLATGRADQTALNLIAAHPGVTLLAKPFSLHDIRRQLEQLR